MDAASETDLRAARPEDARAIADILCDAFTGDPVMSWMFGRAEPPYALFHELARCVYLARGFGHVIEDKAATLWLPAGEKPFLPFLGEARLALALAGHSGLSGLARAKHCGDIVSAHHPAAPHYYLFAVGVRDGHKGKGHGGRVLREGLKRVDEAAEIAYLENSKPRNTPLYQRLGFEPGDLLPLPKGAPPLLAMTRGARSRLN